jgi:hypothetical protein
MDEESVEIELCCEGLQDAIDSGAVLILPQGGSYVESVLCEDGKSAIRINFCPFCGAKRYAEVEAEAG